MWTAHFFFESWYVWIQFHIPSGTSLLPKTRLELPPILKKKSLSSVSELYMTNRPGEPASRTGVKKLRVRVAQCPPPYKLIGCHGIKSTTLIRVDDMYNVSPLSWIGTPDISSLGPYNIWHRGWTGDKSTQKQTTGKKDLWSPAACEPCEDLLFRKSPKFKFRYFPDLVFSNFVPKQLDRWSG